jgi:hypothetical protein
MYQEPPQGCHRIPKCRQPADLCWLCTAKKPTLMPMHKLMRRQVQLLSYLKDSYLCQIMEVPTAQEKSERIFFAQPKAHQFKFSDLNKMVPTDPHKIIAFFEQSQATNKVVAGIFKKIAKDKKQAREKKTAHLPVAHSRESSYQQHCCHKCHDYHEATNAIATTSDLTIIIKTIYATIVLIATIRTQRATSPTKRRMIASVITSRKRAMRPCKMTSPFCRVWAICPEKESLLLKISFGLSFLVSLLFKQQELQQPSCR